MKFKNHFFSIVAVLALGLAVVGCSDDSENNPINSSNSGTEPQMDIVETATAAGNFTTLLAAAKAADLVDALKSEGPMTVFAPTDEAFAALPPGTIDALLQDTDALTAILTYHVVPGAVTAEQVVKLSSAPTLNGAELTITVTGDGKVMVDGATVVMTDIKASNGIIHVIDAVVIPGAYNGGVEKAAFFGSGNYPFGGCDQKRSSAVAHQALVAVYRVRPDGIEHAEHGRQSRRSEAYAHHGRAVHAVRSHQ